jgi:hypothetical protein
VTGPTKPVADLKREKKLRILLQQGSLPSPLRNREQNRPDHSGVSQNVTGLEDHNGRTEKKSESVR